MTYIPAEFLCCVLLENSLVPLNLSRYTFFARCRYWPCCILFPLKRIVHPPRVRSNDEVPQVSAPGADVLDDQQYYIPETLNDYPVIFVFCLSSCRESACERGIPEAVWFLLQILFLHRLQVLYGSVLLNTFFTYSMREVQSNFLSAAPYQT